jgi:hypothetical protein
MQSLVGWTILVLVVATIIQIRRRRLATAGHRGQHCIVRPDEAKVRPYPYTFVNSDGSARELHPSEREYLETYFDHFDSGRPYVKRKYSSEVSGERRGYLKRSKLPHGIEIHPAPTDDPMSREASIQFWRDKGYEVIENADGTWSPDMTQLRRPKH